MAEDWTHEQCVRIICAGPTTENTKGPKISKDFFYYFD